MCHPSHHTEPTANDDGSIRLHRNAQYVEIRVGIKARIQRAICVHARQVASSRSANRGEVTADKNLAIYLECQTGETKKSDTRDVGIEAGIKRSVGVESSNAVASYATYAREITPDDNVSSRIHRSAIHNAIRVGVKSRFYRAVPVKSRNAVAWNTS